MQKLVAKKNLRSLSKFERGVFVTNENYELREERESCYDTPFMWLEADCTVFCYKTNWERFLNIKNYRHNIREKSTNFTIPDYLKCVNRLETSTERRDSDMY
jgi:hypothetical protein